MSVMARRNLRLIAQRTGWPAGAIDACETLNAKHPDLVMVWRPANTRPGFESPPGFYAFNRNDDPLHHGVKRREWYGETIDQLRQVLPTGVEHQPDRSTWDCVACGQAWPCAPARSYLIATTPARSDLTMRMTGELYEAIPALAGHERGELYKRFVTWARHP